MRTLLINTNRQPTRLSRAFALLLTATVLLLAVLAVSPEAHHWMHSDAAQQEHDCAITLYAHGATAPFVGTVLAVVVWLLLLCVAVRCDVFVQAPAFSHLPGRAPPVR